jgi:hypothetical protein
MAKYEWIILKEDGEPCDHVIGPNGAKRICLQDFLDYNHIVMKFRMSCEGDYPVEGLFIGDWNSEDGFAPLDDYGMPSIGCTEIEYFSEGRWQYL